MNPQKPSYQPTEAQRALDALAEQRRERLAREGRATELERRESLVAPSLDRVLSVADVMPEMLSALQRVEQRVARHYAELREQVAAAPPWIACKVHPEVRRAIDIELCSQRTRESGAFTAAYAPCVACEAEETRQRQRRYWARRGVPERVLEATFRSYDAAGEKAQAKAEAVATVRGWVAKRGNFLLLTGTPGTGKGHLAAAAMKAIGDGVWIEHVNMLMDLRASYQTKTTEEVIARWQNAESLTLDEFGLSAGGRDEEPLLYQVLAYRYEHRRPTIITSNLDRSEVRTLLGDRLLDRIREDLTTVTMAWGSYRTGK